MRAFSLKTRDGLTIYGYLTIPKGADPKNLPLIVNPHGGPMGPRDNWGYNSETQLVITSYSIHYTKLYDGGGGEGGGGGGGMRSERPARPSGGPRGGGGGGGGDYGSRGGGGGGDFGGGRPSGGAPARNDDPFPDDDIPF